MVYEAARRSNIWPVIFTTLRSCGSPADFFLKNNGWESIYEFLSSCPEFPETPWMLIEPTGRQQRINALSLRAHRWQAVESYHPWGRYKDQPHEDAGPWWNKFEIFAKYRSRSIHDRMTILRIDWQRKDQEIVNAFAKWLKNGRNADFAAYAGRGKSANRNDILKAALRTLGAWSLSPRYNPQLSKVWTRAEAFKHSKVKNENNAEAPLYPDEKEMRKAERKAATLIAALEPFALEFIPRFPLLSLGDFHDPTAFIRRLAYGRDPFSKFIWSEFSIEAQGKLINAITPDNWTMINPEERQIILIAELNNILQTRSIFVADHFTGVKLSPQTVTQMRKVSNNDVSASLNRLLLHDAYPTELKRDAIPKSLRTGRQKWPLTPANIHRGCKIEPSPDGSILFRRA